MNASPLDEKNLGEMMQTIEGLEEELRKANLLIKALRDQKDIAERKAIADFAGANTSVGAIYRMVELIQATSVTHAQREGNFLLLLAFIDRCWPSHNGRSFQGDPGDDIPF
jgi:hypothetical protein